MDVWVTTLIVIKIWVSKEVKLTLMVIVDELVVFVVAMELDEEGNRRLKKG